MKKIIMNIKKKKIETYTYVMEKLGKDFQSTWRRISHPWPR